MNELCFIHRHITYSLYCSLHECWDVEVLCCLLCVMHISIFDYLSSKCILHDRLFLSSYFYLIYVLVSLKNFYILTSVFIFFTYKIKGYSLYTVDWFESLSVCIFNFGLLWAPHLYIPFKCCSCSKVKSLQGCRMNRTCSVYKNMNVKIY